MDPRRELVPEIQDVLSIYRRVGLGVLAALGFGLAWVVSSLLGTAPVEGTGVKALAFAHFFARIFGWAAIVCFAAAALQAVFAFIYVRWWPFER